MRTILSCPEAFLVRLALVVGLLVTAACTAGVPATGPDSGNHGQPIGAGKTIAVVAAENFYGDVAAQVGGDRVRVVSILSDPSRDPHEYESNADDARAVANANVVVKNGLGYDAFVDKLMSASPRSNRIVVDVGQLTGREDGDNPHQWYDPATMPKVARRLAETYAQLDPANRDYFDTRLQAFMLAEKAVDDRIDAIKAKHRGVRVLATEPVFDPMSAALGLEVVDKDGPFQRAVEQGNDPPASAVARFRQELTTGGVKLFIYNSQAVTPITTEMRSLAEQNGVAIVAVSETQPAGKTYQQWMLDQLKTVEQALES